MSIQGWRTYLLLVPLAIGTLSGCVSTKINPVDHKAFAAFRGGTVVTTQREKPSFAANTAGKAMFGLIGAAAAISAGNDIVRENDLPDPAVSIRQALLADLVTEDVLTPVASTTKTDAMDAEKLAKQYPGGDLLLDVQTVNWSFIYFPTNWSHYRVIYSAKVRLIDTKHSKVVADGFCARVPEETPSSPTRDELLENKAARLKQELATAADYCVKEFRTKVFQRS
jgi:hypothetical protein